MRGSERGNHDDDDDGVGDVIKIDDDLAGLCGAQSGAGEKKLSDVTLSKASNGSKVRCHFHQGQSKKLH